MTKSDSIAHLAEALAKAQGSVSNAKKDSKNPHFNSKYADIAAVLDACREHLAENGLSVLQMPTMRDGQMVLEYMLLHSSGEWIASELPITPVKMDAQGIGSVITYARRYTLQGLAGVASEDDDGNAASGKSENPTLRTFTKPAAANKGQGGANLEEGPVKPPDAAGKNGMQSLKEIAKEAKAILSVKPATLPDGCIEQGQAANFYATFRDSLKPAFRKNSDDIARTWLKKQDIIDGDGNGTAKAILKENFYQTREEAVSWASNLEVWP